jgi:putative ABC transport system substrate-binding protein
LLSTNKFVARRQEEKLMKKLLAILLTLVILATSCLAFTSCGDDGKYTVGVCQLVQHAALDQATRGFVEALKAELGEENVEIDVQIAAGDTNVCNTIIGNFEAKK